MASFAFFGGEQEDSAIEDFCLVGVFDATEDCVVNLGLEFEEDEGEINEDVLAGLFFRSLSELVDDE